MKKNLLLLFLSIICLGVSAQTLLNESFDGASFPPSGWVKSSPDGGTGWTRVANGTVLPGWQSGTATVRTGTYAAYATWTTGGSSSNDQWLITPQITPEAGDSLSFYLMKFSQYDDNFDVLVSTTNTQTSSFSVLQANALTSGSGFNYTRYAYSLNSYAGTPIYIAFREHVADNQNDGAALLIEDVQAGHPMDYDAAISSFLTSDFTVINQATNISIQVRNVGMQTITSLDLNYKINNGTAVSTTINGLNIPQGSVATVTHTTPWTPSAYGNYSVAVQITLVNSQTDGITTNNSISKDITVGSGATTPRNVLIEEFSTAWCSFCPDGAKTLNEILLSNPNRVIGVAHHAGYYTDAMTIPEHSEFAQSFDIQGAPSAVIDRIPVSEELGISRGEWASVVSDRLLVGSRCKVGVASTYTPSTRELTVLLTAEFVDYVSSGDYRFNLFIVEDNVTGTGNGSNGDQYRWDQAGAGDSAVGYKHRHVVRDVVDATTFGTAGIISSNPIPGDKFIKHYSITLDADWDADNIEVVGFVSNYSSNDINKMAVLNAVQGHLNEVVSTEEISMEKFNSNIYPNPVNDLFTINFNLQQSENVKINIFDNSGKLVLSNIKSANFGVNNFKFDSKDLNSGLYFVQIESNSLNETIKMIVE